MKKLVALFLISVSLNAYSQAFRFAFISDTHIGSPNGGAEEDLRRTVRDINATPGIAFVVLTGDITELGTNEELKLAKQILDSLNVKWYIIPGNHDTGWSESGGVMFTTVFGYDKFSFEYNSIRFLGCASGPYLRMSDGHVPRNAVNWLDKELKDLQPGQPVIFLNHYPIDNGLDNWYEITDRLRTHNTWAILCGHGHTNKAMNFEDIPGVMGRSNLRAKAAVGGYNLVDVRSDSMIFTERRPGVETLKPWTGVKIETRNFEKNKKFPRPDYSINSKYGDTKEIWHYSSDANIISTPAVSGDNVIVGNQNGKMICLSLKKGKEKWTYQTEGSIFSSPAISGDRVVFGSGDGTIHCLDVRTGKPAWTTKAGAAVLGAPLIVENMIYIGSSDHTFRKLDIANGKEVWKYTGLNGPVVSTPILYLGRIIFGAWDRNLYSLDENTGALMWQWNNGSSIRNYSPAACMPVAHDGVIYVVAPDRYISAIDAKNGSTLWRNNDATVRESIGISADGKWIYGKTMQDTIVAYHTSREKQFAAWKMFTGFGYEHVPSMLIEKEGAVFFGTKSGVVYSIDPSEQKINWAWKIDNSMVNTVRPLEGKRLVAATMDGKIVLLKNKMD
ncbi:MAG TPA: PQQ-binding-like beta-propeller repeat protein [Chitinophagaceae bacterium]|jgi:outer membrane protein assembly factor BamB/predicted phosphodiesterase|nr:PQQ-binding-like beta-propeller repeat protein [Chitinophagaceae bacterium]